MTARTINNGGGAGDAFGLRKSSLHHFLLRRRSCSKRHTNSFLTVVMRRRPPHCGASNRAFSQRFSNIWGALTSMGEGVASPQPLDLQQEVGALRRKVVQEEFIAHICICADFSGQRRRLRLMKRTFCSLLFIYFKQRPVTSC